MSGEWVESSILVGHQPVGVSVRRLNPEERERAAAEIAWSTHRSVSPESILETTWETFIEHVISRHVTFTIPEDQLPNLQSTWWNELVGRALGQLVEANGLAPVLNRHMQALERVGRSGSGAS